MKVNWRKAKFGDVAQVITGSTPSTQKSEYFGGEIPFVTPAELDSSLPITKSKTTLTTLGAEQARTLPSEAVMVCCIGSLGKIGIAGTNLVTNQQINSLIFDKTKVFPRYGYHYCRTLKHYLEHIAPSTTLPIINKSRFSAIEIPLPPLPEQKRIAEVLDKADALREKRRLALQKLNTLLQSVFLEMFGDPVKNPKGWETVPLEQIALKVTDGEHQTPERTTEGVKLLSARNVRNGYIDLTQVDYISEREYERITKRCNPEVGDVLISCSGTIGRVTTVSLDEKFTLVRSVALIKPDSRKIVSKFLEYYLRTEYLRATMIKRANASSQANLFIGQIKQLPVLVPPIDVQIQFSNKAKEIDAGLVKMNSSFNLFQNLFQSLQQRAFKGELFSDESLTVNPQEEKSWRQTSLS